MGRERRGNRDRGFKKGGLVMRLHEIMYMEILKIVSTIEFDLLNFIQ